MPLCYPCLSNLDLLWDHSVTVSLRDNVRISTCLLTCYLVSWTMTFFHAQTPFYLRNPLNQTPAHTLPLQWNTFSPKDQKICAFFRCQKCTNYVLFLKCSKCSIHSNSCLPSYPFLIILLGNFYICVLWIRCYYTSLQTTKLQIRQFQLPSYWYRVSKVWPRFSGHPDL